MDNNNIFLLKHHEVLALLDGREEDIARVVAEAYKLHAQQLSSLPHSLFLQFPDEPKNRIIALPAALGGGFNVAGLKWIASYPSNLEKGLDRASAVIILNSRETGQPFAIIEGSAISARRTAASAALAARPLCGRKSYTSAALIGCGLINFEITRFLLALYPGIERLVVHDLVPERAATFRNNCRQAYSDIQVEVAENMEAALAAAPLISLATTAAAPHITDLSVCAPGTNLLHVSLRDLAPEIILSADNIVDDVDHVCRAQTSVHLAEQLTGNREFIRCTLADILMGTAPPRRDEESIAIFSPFGLGVLDLAVARLVYDLASEQAVGTAVNSFLPSHKTNLAHA
jgi:2,3-diaminopropionate biosynthesis protein SbnB